MGTPTGRTTVKSARRVLEILEYFDREHPIVTVMEMARALSYPQSSTSELLRSLARLGYLHYDRYRRTYSPKARVALLGAWVNPELVRGGAVLEAVDRIAELVGETVLLSTTANYVVQHLHVVHPTGGGVVVDAVRRSESMIHSVQGRLILSHSKDGQIRSALHRMNAEESDPTKRVLIPETLQELRTLRELGHSVQPDARSDGLGVIAVLLPPRSEVERFALSVVAPGDVVAARGQEILRILRRERDSIFPPAAHRDTRMIAGPGFDVVTCSIDETRTIGGSRMVA